jgi:hypothetical protein
MPVAEYFLFSCHKHLGLIFNDKMTWSDHIDDICNRSNKRLDIISKMRYLLPRLCVLCFVTLIAPVRMIHARR